MSINAKMTALADEIRELSGTTTVKSIDAMTSDVNAANTEITGQMNLISQIANALEGKASGGGVTLPSLSNPASASDILSGKEAINSSGNKMTGTIATKTSSDLTASGATVTVPAGYYASNATKSVSTATQATPSVSIDSAGKITASATQTAGYVGAGTKTGTKQLTTKTATTYIPSTANQTIASGTYLTGVQTIKGDANLIASNIKSGVSIFNVTGSYEGSSGGSTAAIETANVTLINTNMEDNYSVYGTWVDNNYISSYATDVYCDDSEVKTVVKGSYITLDSAIVKSIEGDWSQIGYESLAQLIAIRNDCTITLK